MLILVALAVAACGAVEPNIYVDREFDRTREGFGVRPDDLAEVVVCYNTLWATPEEVADLAVARCAEYGKTARFRDHEYRECPLMTPAGAVYDCAVP